MCKWDFFGMHYLVSDWKGWYIIVISAGINEALGHFLSWRPDLWRICLFAHVSRVCALSSPTAYIFSGSSCSCSRLNLLEIQMSVHHQFKWKVVYCNWQMLFTVARKRRSMWWGRILTSWGWSLLVTQLPSCPVKTHNLSPFPSITHSHHTSTLK